jgi:hypothetical protein
MIYIYLIYVPLHDQVVIIPHGLYLFDVYGSITGPGSNYHKWSTVYIFYIYGPTTELGSNHHTWSISI